MSLGQKTLAIVFLTATGLMAMLYGAARILIQKSFLDLEARETQNAVQRAQNALNDDIAGLAATANDYAAWDRTYEFMQSFSADYVAKEFEDDTLQGLSLNSILLVDNSGKIIFFKAYDLIGKRPVETPPEIPERLAANFPHSLAEQETGLLFFRQHAVMVAACPILTTSHKGPARGILIMTRDLDPARVRRLEAVTRSSLMMEFLPDYLLSAEFHKATQEMRASGQEIWVEPMNGSTVAGYALIRDLNRNPILVLRLDTPRTLFNAGIKSLRYFLGTLFLGGVTFGAASLLLLRKTVVAPLTFLHAEVEQITKRKLLSRRVTARGRDELGNLALAINGMLEAMENSELQFRHIADNIHEVFWIRGAHSDETQYVSLAYESLWEGRRSELYRNSSAWMDAVHPDDRQIVEEMRRQQKRGKTGAAEYRVVHRDGSVRWIRDRYFPVNDEAGHTKQIAGLAEDISEFRKAEQVLRRSQEDLERLVSERTAELAAVNKALIGEEEHFRELFATIPLPICLCAAESHEILEVNEAATQVYGYSRDEFLTKTIEDLHLANDVPRLREELEKLSTTKSLSQGWKHRTKEGRLLDVELTSLRVNSIRGSAFLVAIHDVTERLHMEVELRLGQKLQAVGELAASIAHEINTPIQFVGDNLQFLQGAFASLMPLVEKHEQLYESFHERCEPHQVAEINAARKAADLPFLRQEIPPALIQATEGVTRVATIVQALRRFSHVDWGPEKADADINEAIESTLVVAGGEFKYVAGVETNFGDLPPVKCFIGDLNQVFLNLLVNASHAIGDVVKKTGQRGKIGVTTSTDGEWAVIAISDTGTGIPVEVRERIFDPFFTTKEVGKGTGQGLALARAIVVERHGGTLSFDTEIGKGTTFYIRIPVNPASRTEDAIALSAASSTI